MIKAMILAAAALTMGTAADAQTMIQKNDIKVENHLMTPEALWAMGRIGGAAASPDGKTVVYQVMLAVDMFEITTFGLHFAPYAVR